MKIVVIGAGGVGGYFGGRITKAGYDTTFIVRGQSLHAIETHGLRIKSILGNFKVNPKVTDDFNEVKDADLILLSVKSWQIENIAAQLKPFLKPQSTVLPLQNGADNADRLTQVLPVENVIAGLCRIVSKLESPGVIDHFGYEPEIIFGEITNQETPRIKSIKSVFDKAGIKNRISGNIQRDIWLKFLFIASISAMGALTRSVLGVMREDPFLRKKLLATALEIILIGQKQGIDLHENDIDRTFELIDKLDFNTTMSLQRDILEGKPSELENFNGYIVQQGDLLGIETPVNDFIYYSLRPMEEKVRFRTLRL
jgi:2-dehydropantoate 2-reductase